MSEKIDVMPCAVDHDDTEKHKRLALTEREKQCMLEMIENNTPQEIAEELNISEKTVFFYMNSIQYKFSQYMLKAFKIYLTK